MNSYLTESQRCYLEVMAKGPLSVLDVRNGGSSQCVQRLLRKGLAVYVSMQDWRDGTYQITDAGRAALSAGDAT